MVTIGKYLKTKRFFKDLTMRQVVDMAKSEYNFSTSTSVLSSIETNKNRVVDGELLLVLSDMYEFDLKELRNIALENIKDNGRKERNNNRD